MSWVYKAGSEECGKCGERLTWEVEYWHGFLGPGVYIILREFCWTCEEPVPYDWLREHEEAEKETLWAT